MRVVCEQLRDGIPDAAPVDVPGLVGEGRHGAEIVERDGETPAETLARKLAGAEYHGWQVARIAETEFHAWKEYADGDGTPDRPHRKDRYFRIVD